MNESLVQNPFRQLVLTFPGRGSYVIRTRPFRGAEQRGQFQGNTLTFRDGPTSIRVVSDAPMLTDSTLDPDAAIPAYVRRSPYGQRSDRDFEDAALGMTLLEVDSVYTAQLDASAHRLAPALRQYNQTSLGYNTRLSQFRVEHAAFLGEIAAFEQMRAAYMAEAQRYEVEHNRVLAVYDQVVRGSTTQSRAAYAADVERLEDHAQRLATMHAELEDAQGYLMAEHRRLTAASQALREEVSAYDDARQTLLNEHAQLIAARDRLRTE
ncbi:MAG: hypothetical protein HKN04_08260 [Rhodothermaceae bacterium]|nr:hypothetical protein [Rhodothermaceae bacterium]